MTTSRASLSCASAAIRRACSIGFKPAQCSPAAGVEALAGRISRDRRRNARRRRPRLPRGGRAARARRPGSARARRTRRAPAARGRRAPRRALAREAGPRRDARAARGAAPRPAPARRGSPQNWSAPIRKTGVAPLGVRAQRVDGARVLVEHDLVVGERGAGEAQPHVGGRLDVLVARVGRRRARRAARARAPPSRARASSTWPLCGGSNEPPKSPIVTRARTPRRRSRPRRRPSRRRRAARARAPRRPAACRATRKPPSVRSSRHGARLRLRAVDEEVGHRPRRARPARARARARTADGGTPRAPRPSRTRARKTAITRSSSIANAGSGARSILFRTTICGRSSRPAP